MKTQRPCRELVQLEMMLGECVQRVGRTLQNLSEWSGGYGSSTPGSGSPGGGGGGFRTMAVVNVRDEVMDRVPVTSVELLAFARPDKPSTLLAEIPGLAFHSARRGSFAVAELLGEVVAPASSRSVVADVSFASWCAGRLLKECPDRPPVAGWLDWWQVTDRLWRVVRSWGVEPHTPVRQVDDGDSLAMDMSEEWCRRCLLFGCRSPRSKDYPELCSWCGSFKALHHFLPPEQLVRKHDEGGRVTQKDIDPFRQSYLDRLRVKEKPAPKRRRGWR